MASDKKNVEISFKITGLEDPKALSAFQKSLDSVQKSLNGIKDNKNLKKLSESLTSLSKIKLPDVSKFANGLEKIKSIKSFPSLDIFVKELDKFTKIKIPNFSQLVNGFISLNKSSLHTDKIGARIRVLVRNIKKFDGIKVPNLEALTKSLANLVKVPLSGFTNKMNSVSTALKKLDGITVPKGLTAFTNSLKYLVKLDIPGLRTKIRQLSQALVDLDKSGHLKSFSDFASNLATLDRSLKSTAQQTQKARESFNKLNKTVQQSSGQMRTFGDRLKLVSQYRIMWGIMQGITDALTGGRDAIVDYDQALKDLQAITGASGREVELMGDKIKEVASTTKFSATEVAEGMKILGQSGFSASESIETIEAVADLATGTLSDMSVAVDLITTAMRVFDLQASQSADVADTFANAVNSSKLTIDKLNTAMNYVGPIANEAGVSVDELAAAMGILANSGLRASTIGTGLRRVFSELVSPSKKMRDAVKSTGIALSDLDPRTNSLSDVIKNLRVVLSETGVAFDIFGKRGASAALSLVDYSNNYDLMFSKIKKSGTAAKMAAIQIEGLAASAKNLFDKLKNLAIAVGEAGLSGAFKILIDVARVLTDILTKFTESVVGSAIVKLGILAGAIGAVAGAWLLLKNSMIATAITAAINSITLSVRAMAGAWAAYGVTMKGIGLALGGWVAVIGAIIIAFELAVRHFTNAGKKIKEALNLSEEFKKLSDSISDWSMSIVSMKKGSIDLKEANLKLRENIIKTSESLKGDLATAAQEAILSINPLTGEITDGTEALKKYRQELEKASLTKLVESANELSDSFGNAFNIDQLEEMAIQLKEIDRIGNAGRSFANVDNITEQYNALYESALKLFDRLYKSGMITFQSTTEEVKSLADQLGLTTRLTENLLSVFNRFKGVVTAEGIIGEWKDAPAKEVYEFINSYKKLGDQISKADKERIKGYAERQKYLRDELLYIEENAQAEIRAGHLSSDVRNRASKKSATIMKQVSDLRKELADDEIYMVSQSLSKQRQITKDSLEKINANYRISDKERAEERERILEESAAKELQLQKQLEDAKARVQLDEQQKRITDQEIQYKQYLLQITALEAKGTISHTQAEALKTKTTIDHYRSSFERAKEYYEGLTALNERDSKLEEKALAKMKKAAEDYYAKTLELTQNSFEKELKELNKFNKSKEKLDVEYNKKRERIHKSALDKITDAEEAFAKKKKTLNEKILTEDQKHASDKVSIREDIKNRQHDILMEEMSDVEKRIAEESRLNEELNKSRTLIDDAEIQKDKEKLDAANDILKSALGRVSALEDQAKKLDFLQKIEHEMLRSRDVEKDVVTADYEKQIADAEALKNKKISDIKEEEAYKLNSIKTTYDYTLNAEKERHKQVMQNLKAEQSQFEKITKLSKALFDYTGKSVDTESPTISAPDSDFLDEIIPDIKEVEIKFDSTEAKNAIAEIKKETEELTKELYIINGRFTDVWRNTKNEIVRVGEATEGNLDEMIKGAEKFKDVWEDTWTDSEGNVHKLADSDELKDITDILFGMKSIEPLDIAPEEKDKATVKEISDELTKIENFKAPKIVFNGIEKTLSLMKALVKEVAKLNDVNVNVGANTVTAKTGKRIPGYGGGDRVPALLEPGEWVIRKESVKRFGDSFMSSINSGRLGIANGLSKVSNGISDGVQRFKTGGQVLPQGLSSLSDFGRIEIDTGKETIPALVHKDVFAEVTNRLSMARRFAT